MNQVQIDWLPPLAIVCGAFLVLGVVRVLEWIADRRASERTRALIDQSRK